MADDKKQEAKHVADHQTIEQMDVELKRLEIEEKKLAIAMNKANLEDVEERIQERMLKRDNTRQRSLTNGETLRSTAAADLASQNRCNHRKGGNGVGGIVGGQGDDNQYAVLKHTFVNGDMWIRCLRCGKTWKPPVASHHKTTESFAAAALLHSQAMQFSTRNVPSGSVAFRFSDGGENYREVTASSTLR